MTSQSSFWLLAFAEKSKQRPLDKAAIIACIAPTNWMCARIFHFFRPQLSTLETSSEILTHTSILVRCHAFCRQRPPHQFFSLSFRRKWPSLRHHKISRLKKNFELGMESAFVHFGVLFAQSLSTPLHVPFHSKKFSIRCICGRTATWNCTCMRKLTHALKVSKISKNFITTIKHKYSISRRVCVIDHYCTRSYVSEDPTKAYRVEDLFGPDCGPRTFRRFHQLKERSLWQETYRFCRPKEWAKPQSKECSKREEADWAFELNSLSKTHGCGSF